MSTEWLTVRSFQHNQRLLTAINTLSIHLKLKSAGFMDKETGNEVNESEDILRNFLRELETYIVAEGDDYNKSVLGADERKRQLARSFVLARRDSRHYRSLLFRNSPIQVSRLLDNHSQDSQDILLQCLDELRQLLEAHIHEDTRKILGEI